MTKSEKKEEKALPKNSDLNEKEKAVEKPSDSKNPKFSLQVIIVLLVLPY